MSVKPIPLSECDAGERFPPYINPYRLFTGSLVPNWLLERTEVSQGAKLAYARLSQHAGKNGVAWPKRETLAAELGVTPRQIDRYLKELETHRLVEIERLGLTKANRYRFRMHEWMSTFESTFMSTQELTDTSSQESPDMSTPIKRIIEENQKKSCDSPIVHRTPDPSSTAKRKLTQADPKDSDPRVKPFLSWFAEEHEKRFGAPYSIHWGKDGKRIKELPPAFELPRLKDLATRFFESGDPWIQHRGGFTVGVFTSQINKLTSTTNSDGTGNAKPHKVQDLGDGWLEIDGMKISREDYDRRWNNNAKVS